MTEKHIEEVTEEVIRRLELLNGKQRALVFRNGPETDGQLKRLQESMKAQEYTFTHCFIGSEGEGQPFTVHDTLHVPSSTTGAYLEKSIGIYDAVVVAGLRMAQLTALRGLAIEGTCLSLVFEALRQGKEVYLLSKDLELAAASMHLRSEVYTLMLQLEQWGVHFPQIKQSSGKVVDKNLVAMQDVCGLEVGPLMVGPKTMFTSAARDYLRDRKIKVVYR